MERYVKEEVDRLVRFYVEAFASALTGYLRAAIRRYRQIYSVSPIVSTTTEIHDNYTKVVVEMSLSPEQIARIEQVVRDEVVKKSTTTKLRLKTLYKLIHDKLDSGTGELDAVLSGMRSTTSEGDDKAGGGGEEVRG